MEQISWSSPVLDPVLNLSFNSEQSYEADNSKPTTLMRKRGSEVLRKLTGTHSRQGFIVIKA